MQPVVDPVYLIVCDDIREEKSNKDILVGVYTGDILVPAFPAIIALAAWMKVEASQLGAVAGFEFQVVRAKTSEVLFRVPPTNINISARTDFVVRIPGMQIVLSGEDTLKFQIKQAGSEWKEAGNIVVGRQPAT
jgi:hypothetical protein